MFRRYEIRDPRLILAGFFLLGIIFAGIGIGWTHRTITFRNTAFVAEGTVTDLVSNGRGQLAPRFEFYDLHGRRNYVQSPTHSSPPAFSVGDRVRILYDPDEPARARIDSVLELWLGPGIFLILGFAFVGLSVLVWWFVWGERTTVR